MSELAKSAFNAARHHKFLAALALTGVMYGVGHSGGPIDRVDDHLQNAGDVVHSTLDDPDHTPIEQRTFDGIPFTRYPAEAQTEIKTEEKGRVDAIDRLAETMNDLDGHKYAAIQKRAAEFRSRHYADIMSASQKQQYLDEIQHDKDSAAVISSLDRFMAFYGKHAATVTESTDSIKAFNPSIGTGNVKAVATQIVNAYSYLPKEFVHDAQFDAIELGSAGGDDEGDAAGTTIKLTVHHAVFRQITHLSQHIPSMLSASKETSNIATPLHELGHKESSEYSADDPSVDAGYPQQLMYWLLNKPHFVSKYSLVNRDEAGADTFSAAFDINQGPTHPDEARRFSSEANKAVLTDLYTAEVKFPGITDYLVSMNGHLVSHPAR